MSIKTKIYPSGLRLVVDEKQGYESISLYNYLGVGSADEDETNRGVSHFIEHMLFKGTPSRSSNDITSQLDNLGTIINAYTTPTATAINIKAIKETLKPSLEILSDIWFNSDFKPEELEKERNVVLEELAMNEDDKQTIMFNLLMESTYKGTNYQYEIAGTKESVSALTRQQLVDYKEKNYVPNKMVLSFSGDITFEEADELVQEYYEKHLVSKYGKNQVVINKPKDIKHEFAPEYTYKTKNEEHANLTIAFPSYNIFSENLTALNLLSEIVGGGIGSLIYNELTDKLGLSYHNYSFIHGNPVGGYFGVYIGCTNDNIKSALTFAQKVLFDIATNGISKKVFNTAKIKHLTTLKFSTESTDSMSDSHATEYGMLGNVKTKEEAFKEITDLDLDKFNKLVKDILLTKNVAISCVGQPKENLLKLYQSEFDRSVTAEEEFEATA